MQSVEKMPTVNNVPELHGNIEGLKRHSFGCLLVPEPLLSDNDRKLRAWLLHTVASASRHYSKARELVLRQEAADYSKDGGSIFHILDVSEQLEDCVMATYRVCMAIRKLNSYPKAEEFSSSFQNSIELLRSIRNQFDHMHTQITSGETGGGPLSIIFGNEGKSIKFRKLSMDTVLLHELIDEAYRMVASLYPSFNVNSAKESGGAIRLTLTTSFKTTNAN